MRAAAAFPMSTDEYLLFFSIQRHGWFAPIVGILLDGRSYRRRRWEVEIPTGMEVAVDGRTPEGSPPPSRPYGHMGVELIGS